VVLSRATVANCQEPSGGCSYQLPPQKEQGHADDRRACNGCGGYGPAGCHRLVPAWLAGRKQRRIKRATRGATETAVTRASKVVIDHSRSCGGARILPSRSAVELYSWSGKRPRTSMLDRTVGTVLIRRCMFLTDGGLYGGAMCERSVECPHCHMTVTAMQRRIVDDPCVYHCACYEAWYFGKFGKLPRLRRASTKDRNDSHVVRRSA
jgi:hypothetical protein